MGDKLKVYLETSFVSYLTGVETSNAKIAADQAYTRQWWEQEMAKCDVYVSNYTLDESAKGNADLCARRDIVSAAGYVCPQVMTPRTFIENLNMEVKDV